MSARDCHQAPTWRSPIATSALHSLSKASSTRRSPHVASSQTTLRPIPTWRAPTAGWARSTTRRRPSRTGTPTTRRIRSLGTCARPPPAATRPARASDRRASRLNLVQPVLSRAGARRRYAGGRRTRTIGRPRRARPRMWHRPVRRTGRAVFAAAGRRGPVGQDAGARERHPARRPPPARRRGFDVYCQGGLRTAR